MTSQIQQAVSRRGCVVIINYHFPPDGSVGGLRWAGFAKYLARLGWEVHVVTSAQQSAAPGIPGLQVHTVPRGTTLNDRYNRAAEKFRSRLPARQAPPKPSGASDTRDGAQRRSLLGAIRAELSASLVFPDQARGWLLRAGRRARHVIRTHKPDVLISSGPPHTAHLAARIALRGTRIPHVVDMRDPWTSFAANAEAEVVRSSRLRSSILPRLERYIFSRAAHIIANARDLAEAHARRRPDLPISWLPNGIDMERLPEPSRERDPGLAIAYVGTLYFGRDLAPVLEAFARFLDRNPDARSDGSALRIAGNIMDEHRGRLEQQLHMTGTGQHVQLLGPVAAASALAILNRASVAIVLAQDQQLQVPAKIYESVGMGIPTLVITEPSSASAREADRIGAFAAAADDVERICRIFEDIRAGRIPPRLTPSAPISYAHLTRELDSLLCRIARRSAS